ncbi:MAG: FumA C-terminus/TtdB family hydratase beta subunit [Candidatus Omnitrophota bacterium]
MKRIKTPLEEKELAGLEPGDEVLLSGRIYTSRDQAHARMTEAIRKRKGLPIDLRRAVIYYCGPAKAARGKPIGSCGPTTSSRMDAFTPLLLKYGLRGMIGKGGRSQKVSQAIKKYKAVYFLAPAGCGALITRYVKSARPAGYQDLGPESILELEVKDFPLIVAIDTKGRSIYGKA